MELELNRVDYTIVGLTSANCLKLLPAQSEKEQQKVAVADVDGILQVFSLKKDDIQLHFKTLPGPKVSSLQLAGAPGSLTDKIFLAAENEVRGYTRKGKLFLSFDSSLTEPIVSMCVLENDLFLCGKHTYNHYRDCKDVGSYLCGDRIVDVMAFVSEKSHRLISLIACEGRMIRALEHARVTLSMEIETSPTVLKIFEEENEKHVLFGTIDGRIGILDVEGLQGFQRWLVTNNVYSGAISCIDGYDLNGNGTKNLILARQDGNIEVYIINLEDEKEISSLIYVHNCNESVTSIQCGVVGLPGYDEIVVATFTGRIFGLTTETIEKAIDAENVNGTLVFSNDTKFRILKLKSDVEELKGKLQKEREKYQSSTMSFFDEMSAIPILSVNDSMVLSKDTSTYALTIELPMAIDNILIQSDVLLLLLDVEKNSAVVSYSNSAESDGNVLLATYRCQLNTNRLELKIRTTEGQAGVLQAYITPFMQPKCSRVKQYIIRPLSLHYRIHQIDEKRPLNVLTVKGTFSLAEIHSWVYNCIPEVPEKPVISEKPILGFQSSFLNTILHCSYQKGEGEFKSDNISTIAIIKDFITNAATKKKIKIEINTIVSDESIGHVIKLFESSLLYQQELLKKVAILDALNELEVSEEESRNYLTREYKNLLNDEKEIRNEYKKNPDYLTRVYDAVSGLYLDYNKFKGNSVKSKLTRLQQILENYNYNTLISFFRPDILKMY